MRKNCLIHTITPARYNNQLHKGDIFIYYQWNLYDKSQKYCITIGKVISDGEIYYAKLLNCQQFEKNFLIYLPDGGYIEQLGYEIFWKSLLPLWQSWILRLSQEVFDYILNSFRILLKQPKQTTLMPWRQTEDATKSKQFFKRKKFILYIWTYYICGDISTIPRIENIASAIGKAFLWLFSNFVYLF